MDLVLVDGPSALMLNILVGIGIGTGLMFCFFVPAMFVWIKSIAITLMEIRYRRSP